MSNSQGEFAQTQKLLIDAARDIQRAISGLSAIRSDLLAQCDWKTIAPVNKITAIKMVRAQYGYSLKDSKTVIDYFLEEGKDLTESIFWKSVAGEK